MNIVMNIVKRGLTEVLISTKWKSFFIFLIHFNAVTCIYINSSFIEPAKTMAATTDVFTS